MSGDFYHHDWGLGATGIQWVEAKDAAEYPVVQRTAPTKMYPAPNINSADPKGWLKLVW